MTSKTQPESQQHWDTHIKAYLSSKLSMKQYCRSLLIESYWIKNQSLLKAQSPLANSG
ncbi:MAG: hypothetical protein K0U23_08355 [Gammaproteobacteria bacterium]|nr:hypothetical protein [Gammaproteobacteria bacterium]